MRSPKDFRKQAIQGCVLAGTALLVSMAGAQSTPGSTAENSTVTGAPVAGAAPSGSPAIAAPVAPAVAAQTGSGAETSTPVGLVIQARPWRAKDRSVQVDYTVRMEKGSAATGTILAAYRQTPVGYQEGPPVFKVGWLKVIAADRQLAVARTVPGPLPEGPYPGNPVVQVGDQIMLETFPTGGGG